MNRYSTYPCAFLYGFYFYLLFQVVHVARFGAPNWHVSINDLALYLVGTISVIFLMHLMRKLTNFHVLMLIPFLVALPFAYAGALGGGLLGFFGAFALGLLPFIVILPIGFTVVKRSIDQAPRMIV